MTHKTVETYVEVDVDLDEWEDDELIEEMKLRGYTCVKLDGGSGFESEDWQFLLEMIDKIDETWYTRRIREKLLTARFS